MDSKDGWSILSQANSDEVRQVAVALISEDLKKIRSIKKARDFIDYAPDKASMLHLWQLWTADKNCLECTSLRQLAGALRDAVPEVQVLVVVAWCNVTDLAQYGRKDGEYPRKVLCAQAYQVLCDKQNELIRIKEAEAIKALQGGVR